MTIKKLNPKQKRLLNYFIVVILKQYILKIGKAKVWLMIEHIEEPIDRMRWRGYFLRAIKTKKARTK